MVTEERFCERGAQAEVTAAVALPIKKKGTSFFERFYASDIPTDEDRCGEIK